jgi:hypothetical protein
MKGARSTYMDVVQKENFQKSFTVKTEWGALIRLEKTENGAKQNSAVKTKWLLILFWGPPNNITFFSFNFVCP